MMDGFMGGWHGYGGWFGPIWMVVWWGGLAALVAWGIARLTRGHRTDHAHHVHAAHGVPESARAILDRRLAAGEIDAEAYARARRLIEEPVLPPATGPKDQPA